MPPDVKTQFDAIIIDEVDSVALNTNQFFNIVQYIKSSAYNWKEAIEYANRIAPEHIILDLMMNTATLSVDGVNYLRDIINKDNATLNENDFARLRKAVEIAYVSIQMRENYEYTVKNNHIISIDKVTSELAYGITHDWMIPLSITKGAKVPNSKITKHKISTKMLIYMYNHVSGMSGTAQDDMSEYFFEFHLPTIRILPRNARQKGAKEDSVWTTSNGAVSAIIQQAIEAVKQRRPVLIGSQNIMDAEIVYATILQQFKDNGMHSEDYNINLIRGNDSQGVARIYENAGHVGSVTIATQVAGRGVDIRLSKEAKENGGIALFGLERSLSHSQDKQFLGRVGRQGDPYTAQFFVTFEGDLMKRYHAERMSKIMKGIGMSDDEPIYHNWLDKSIKGAQKSYHRSMFASRIGKYMKNRIEKENLLYIEIFYIL